MAGGARWPPDEVVPSSDPVGDEACGIGESGDTSAAWLRGRAGAAPPALQPSPIPDSLPASERIRLEARRRAAAAADDDVLDDDPPHVHQALLSDNSDDALASPFASPAASPRRTAPGSPRRMPQTASPQRTPGEPSVESPRQRPRRAAAQRSRPYTYKPSLKRPTSDAALRERFGMPAPIVNQAPSPEKSAAATFDALIRERRRAVRRGLDSDSLRSVDALAARGIQAEIRAAQALMNAGHDAGSGVAHAGLAGGGPSAAGSSVADASALRASLAGLGADAGTERLAHLLAEDAAHGGLLHAANAPRYATFWPSRPERVAVQVEADWWRSEPAAVQAWVEAHGDEPRLTALLRNSTLPQQPSRALCRWLLHLAVDRRDGAHAAAGALVELARQSSAVAQHVEQALPDVLCRLGAHPHRVAACCGQEELDEEHNPVEAAAGGAMPINPQDTQTRCTRATSLLTTVAAIRAASGRGLSGPTVLALLSHLGALTPPSAAVEVFLGDVMSALERRGSGSRGAAASAWERLVQSSVGLEPSEQLAVLRTLPASTPFAQRFRARAAVGMLVRSALGVPRTDAGAPLAWLLELLTHPGAGFLKPAGADTRNYAQMNARLGQLALATSDLEELVPSAVRYDATTTPAELEAAAHFLQALGTLYREIEDRRGMHAERSQAKSFVQRLQLRLRYQIETRVRASGARDVWATLAGHA